MAEETSEIQRLRDECTERMKGEAVAVFFRGTGNGALIVVHTETVREKAQAVLAIIQPRCKVEVTVL